MSRTQPFTSAEDGPPTLLYEALVENTRLPGGRVVGLQRRFGFPHVIEDWFLYMHQ